MKPAIQFYECWFNVQIKLPATGHIHNPITITITYIIFIHFTDISGELTPNANSLAHFARKKAIWWSIIPLSNWLTPQRYTSAFNKCPPLLKNNNQQVAMNLQRITKICSCRVHCGIVLSVPLYVCMYVGWFQLQKENQKSES